MTTSIDNDDRSTIVARWGTVAGAIGGVYIGRALITGLVIDFFDPSVVLAVFDQQNAPAPGDFPVFVTPFPLTVADFGMKDFEVANGWVYFMPSTPGTTYTALPAAVDLGVGTLVYRTVGTSRPVVP